MRASCCRRVHDTRANSMATTKSERHFLFCHFFLYFFSISHAIEWGATAFCKTAVNEIKEICDSKQKKIEMNTDKATHRICDAFSYDSSQFLVGVSSEHQLVAATAATGLTN